MVFRKLLDWALQERKEVDSMRRRAHRHMQPYNTTKESARYVLDMVEGKDVAIGEK